MGCNRLSFTESRNFDPSTAPPVQRFWYALCKERRRRRGRIAIPHGVGELTNVGWDELLGIVVERNHGKTE